MQCGQKGGPGGLFHFNFIFLQAGFLGVPGTLTLLSKYLNVSKVPLGISKAPLLKIKLSP